MNRTIPPIAGVSSYAELVLTLELAGLPAPSKTLFDRCRLHKEWWYIMCVAIRDSVRPGMSTEEVDDCVNTTFVSMADFASLPGRPFAA